MCLVIDKLHPYAQIPYQCMCMLFMLCFSFKGRSELLTKICEIRTGGHTGWWLIWHSIYRFIPCHSGAYWKRESWRGRGRGRKEERKREGRKEGESRRAEGNPNPSEREKERGRVGEGDACRWCHGGGWIASWVLWAVAISEGDVSWARWRIFQWCWGRDFSIELFLKKTGTGGWLRAWPLFWTNIKYCALIGLARYTLNWAVRGGTTYHTVNTQFQFHFWSPK